MPLLLVLSGPVSSQALDDGQLYLHPGNRYTYEDLSLRVPAHWSEKISVQFSGFDDAELQKRVLLDFLRLADAGGYETEIAGFPNEMFHDSPIGEGVNFLIMELNGSDFSLISNRETVGHLTQLNASISSASIRSILESGLVPLDGGCSMRWAVSSENIIEAVVIAMSKSLDQNQKQSCLSGSMPRAFGTFPFATEYRITLVDSDSGEVSEIGFADRSEVLLQLAASNVCRSRGLMESDCPYAVINEVLKYHGGLAEKFGEQ